MEVYIIDDEVGPVANLVVPDPVADKSGTDWGICEVILDRDAPSNLTIFYTTTSIDDEGNYVHGTVGPGWTPPSIVIPQGSRSGRIEIDGSGEREWLRGKSLELISGEGYALGETTRGIVHVK